jgi:hypothetical protein
MANFVLRAGHFVAHPFDVFGPVPHFRIHVPDGDRLRALAARAAVTLFGPARVGPEGVDPYLFLARISLTAIEAAPDPIGDLIHLSLSRDDRPAFGRARAVWPVGAVM